MSCSTEGFQRIESTLQGTEVAGVSFTKTLLTIAAAYVMSVTAGWAADLCPAGPFETDPRVIAAAIAAQPLKPRVWDESPDSRHTSPPLTDGVVSTMNAQQFIQTP